MRAPALPAPIEVPTFGHDKPQIDLDVPWVEWPDRVSPPEPVNTAPRPVGAASSPLRILLVEDDDGDALLVEELLAITGASVDIVRAATLAGALDTPLGEIDCVLLDLDLPDAHGLTALLRLKDAQPEVAVLVLTGLDDELRGTAAVAAGAPTRRAGSSRSRACTRRRTRAWSAACCRAR